MFQDFKLLTNKTVYENVAFALEVIGRPKHIVRTQVPQILDLVGLTKKADNFPTELSGGEQQRVSIARAFVNRPLILLADEPTGNLDPATTVGIMRLLDRINRTGTTVVMATHDQRIVDAMRRRVDRARPRRARARPGARRLRRRQLMSRLAYFARETLISLRRNLLMTIAGIITVAISLFLFGGILLVSAHGRPRHAAVEARHRARDLHEGRSDANAGADRSRTQLKADPQVKSYKYLTKQDAYDDLQEGLRRPARARRVDEARATCPSRSGSRRIKAELTPRSLDLKYKNQPDVDTVITAGASRSRRLLTATRWIRLAFISMASVLLASSLFLIVNTIRLATFARRREIEVMKLVGASNWFVRVPFMAEGLVQGAIGAGFAFGLVWVLKIIITNLLSNQHNLLSTVPGHVVRRARHRHARAR